MPDRDAKGLFLKGHRALNTQLGHVGGHPKTIKRQVKDALQLAEDAMPDIIQAMILTATGKDGAPIAVVQATREYLCDRIYGRPNQPLSGRGALTLIIKDWADREKET